MQLAFLLCLCLVGSSVALMTNSTQSRLIGASLVQTLDDFPYMVSIQVNGAHKCAGSAISSRWIMTVASCAATLSPLRTTILYNTLIVNMEGIRVGMTDIVVHPEWDQIHYKNNIALIHTSEDLKIVKFAQIPCDMKIMLNAFLQVPGWGSRRDDSNVAVVDLSYIQIPYLAEMCKTYHINLGITIDDTMFCAGEFEHGGIGLCHLDEGGAAVRPGTLIAYGIGSFHYGCGKPRYTSVFTKVSKFASWIELTSSVKCVTE